MEDFEIFEPTSVGEAASLLSRYHGKAKLIAGGTDLLVDMKNGKVNPKCVIDLQAIAALNSVNYNAETGLRLGAMVTMRSLELSPEIRQKYPPIFQAATNFTHVAIRNIATLGGNLCQAVPSADLAPPLIAYSARAKIVSRSKERIIPLEDFFTGLGQTALDAEEILVEIQAPAPPPGARGRNFRYSARATGLPTVVVSVVATMDPDSKTCREIKIVLGNVAPTPIRAFRAEELIRGKKLDQGLINKAAQVTHEEARPRSGSLRASAWYKKEMIMVFVRKAITEVAAH